MSLGKIKIKLLRNINQPKIYSLYKIGEDEVLEFKDDRISFMYHSDIQKKEIISVSKYIPEGMNISFWIKIEFMKGDIKKEIYITSRQLLGFGSVVGKNEQIESELTLKYL